MLRRPKGTAKLADNPTTVWELMSEISLLPFYSLSPPVVAVAAVIAVAVGGGLVVEYQQ
jgi:hypothetical protein